MHTAVPQPGQPLSARALAGSVWRNGDWRRRPIAQQPPWRDLAALSSVRDRLTVVPPLTAIADIRRLEASLAKVAAGQSFLLQAGDCVEPMDASAIPALRCKHELIGSMAETFSDRIDAPTVTIGRLGGQFAKPRSQPTETVAGREVTVFRGPIVNDHRPDPRLRVPDPHRLLAAYRAAKAVLSELHIIAHETATRGLPASDLTVLGEAGGEVSGLARPWDGSLRSVLEGYGETRRDEAGGWSRTGLWTSHESLILDYEEALVRRDRQTGEWFLLSTHLPWIGKRTAQPNGAHVAFHASIANPVACKIGPETNPAEVVELCRLLDPNRRAGRLTLICRMGADTVRDRMPELVRAVRNAGHHPVWVCDPMHGNTEVLPGGRKTRRTEQIMAEIEGFFETLRAAGEWPGGLHLEAAEGAITECIGTGGPDNAIALERNYQTLCDPRLNEEQSMLLADAVSRLVAKG
ncbi:3-deoxy-7-phosphoheptulonate synthase [Salinactinospora qingdaonensis]|uniref:Phospho-2-dehydro-3-deoxyheptonate aldolase n=1 Tax=Salinactinospora qingdaonensis TaxID=702744 RepID=A0ABP7EVY6_9ACTN